MHPFIAKTQAGVVYTVLEIIKEEDKGTLALVKHERTKRISSKNIFDWTFQKFARVEVSTFEAH